MEQSIMRNGRTLREGAGHAGAGGQPQERVAPKAMGAGRAWGGAGGKKAHFAAYLSTRYLSVIFLPILLGAGALAGSPASALGQCSQCVVHVKRKGGGETQKKRTGTG